ncbi:hypothetical protein BGZ58_002461 [Dissophora ornata]|nr:hypothetical protein BGZ58_002461 [Dissophora ornata]
MTTDVYIGPCTTRAFWDKLKNQGVWHAQCYSVDNISIKVGDPIIIGHALKVSVDVTAKAMPKFVANEPLRVICRLGAKIHIVEYSEMDPELAALVNPSNGVKSELFAFDMLALAERFTCMEVERSSGFSPMKNSSALDSPNTSRKDLERLLDR